jgi:NTP pyrophosphatase (non-canonical NTP hydrolase)
VSEYSNETIKIVINALVELLHSDNVKAGWWKDPKIGEDKEVTVDLILSKLCLVHSEVSEACEGIRKDLPDDKLPHRPAGEVELADAVIRICDIAGKLGYDLGGAIIEKWQYNLKREDHKIENRMKPGGKKA